MWKPIEWYEWYEVNEEWIVRSLSYNNTWEIKELKYNWLYCAVRKNARHKNIKVWRLVAHAFLWLNLDDKETCVLHKDWNKQNNRLDNLELWTKWEWLQSYLLINKLITHKKKRTNPEYAEQTQIIKELKESWLTLSQIKEEVWLSTSYISMIVNDKRRVYEQDYLS